MTFLIFSIGIVVGWLVPRPRFIAPVEEFIWIKVLRKDSWPVWIKWW